MHETVILCSWLSLVSTPITRGSIRPALMSAMPIVVEHDVLVVQQRERLGVRRAARADLAPPNCFGSTGGDAAAGAGVHGRRSRLDGHAAPGRSVAVDADEDDVAAVRGAVHAGHGVGVVALQRLELAVLDGAVEEADVAVGAEVVLAAPVVGHDVAGRASAALTICSPFLPCSALRTQVWTAAQPPPGILCPAFSSDHVMNDAHHGFPDGTLAAARYSSTFGPRVRAHLAHAELALRDAERRGAAEPTAGRRGHHARVDARRRPRPRAAAPRRGWRAAPWPPRAWSGSGSGTARPGARCRRSTRRSWFGSSIGLPAATRAFLTFSALSRNHLTCSSGLSP